MKYIICIQGEKAYLFTGTALDMYMSHELLVQSQIGRYEQPYVSPVRIFHLQHLASPRHWADGGIVRRNSPQSRPFLLSGKDTLQGLSEILTC